MLPPSLTSAATAATTAATARRARTSGAWASQPNPESVLSSRLCAAGIFKTLEGVVEMSVPRSQRKESATDFLYYARQLRILSLQKYKTVSKTHRFTIGLPLCESTRIIYNKVKQANTIYPKRKWEANMRRKLFWEAYAETQSLISDLEVAQEVLQFDEKHLYDWMEIVDKELSKIKGIMESDEKRFGNLPE
jgi:hypothetical protein